MNYFKVFVACAIIAFNILNLASAFGNFIEEYHSGGYHPDGYHPHYPHSTSCGNHGNFLPNLIRCAMWRSHQPQYYGQPYGRYSSLNHPSSYYDDMSNIYGRYSRYHTGGIYGGGLYGGGLYGGGLYGGGLYGGGIHAQSSYLPESFGHGGIGNDFMGYRSRRSLEENPNLSTLETEDSQQLVSPQPHK